VLLFKSEKSPQSSLQDDLVGVHFKFTTYHPLFRRGQGEAKEMRKFEMRPLVVFFIDSKFISLIN
jgi:hypothetical protein